MKNISIYNSFIKNNQNKREFILSKLRRHGFTSSKNGDLLLVIGGDGTFLSAVQKRLRQNPIFVGFNAGNLGYFSEFTMDDIDNFIEILVKKDYWIENIPVYEVRMKESDGEKTAFFVNDLVIERKSTRILHMSVQLNDEKLCSISGDGVVVSTPLGSTGYNMSVGGAISLDNDSFYQLTPIAPVVSKAYQSIKNSIVFKNTDELTIFPNYKKQRTFRIVCDGKEIRGKNVRFVEVRKTNQYIRILRSNKFKKTEHLRNKIFNLE